MRSTFMTQLVAIIAAFAATACEMPPDERLTPPSETVTLLWTGSIRGELHPCLCPEIPYGGLARLASTIDAELEDDPNALLIDLGDFAGDTIEGTELDGDLDRIERSWLTLESLGLMGTGLLVPGERDLRLGAHNLRRAAQEARIDLLATNLWLESPSEPYGLTEHWIDTEGGPLVLIGVTAPLGQGHLDAAAQGHERRIQVIDPVAALTMTLDRVEERASAVVILAHGPTDWAREVLAQVDRGWLMIVAHDDEVHALYEQVGNSYLITTGREGQQLGRLRLTLNEGAGYGVGGAGIDVVEEYGERSDVDQLVETLSDRVDAATEELNQANEEDEHPSGFEFVGFASCGAAGCHPDQASAWYETAHVGAFQALQRIGWHIEPECFECHATGFGYAGGFRTRSRTPTLSGVGCEACHGPGESCEARDRPEVTEATCRSCHTEETSPDFDFDQRIPMIRH